MNTAKQGNPETHRYIYKVRRRIVRKLTLHFEMAEAAEAILPTGSKMKLEIPKHLECSQT